MTMDFYELVGDVEVRSIPGYPEYFVTAKGQIISVKSGQPIIRKLRTHPYDKYLGVNLMLPSGAKIQWPVHRLVALAFLPPAPSSKHEIRHIDGNAQNNHVDNLTWGTHLENVQDALRHGTHPLTNLNGGSGKGSNNSCAKLTEEKVSRIKHRLRNGESVVVLAREYGVSHQAISLIKCGKQWRHVE